MKFIIACLLLCHVFINTSSQRIQGRYRRPACDSQSGCSLGDSHTVDKNFKPDSDTYTADEGYRSIGVDGSPNSDKDPKLDKGIDPAYPGDEFDHGADSVYNIKPDGYNTKPVGGPLEHNPPGGYSYKPIRGGQGGYNTKPGSDRDYDAYNPKPGVGDYKPNIDREDPRPGSGGYIPKPGIGDYKPDIDKHDPRPGSGGYIPKPPIDKDDHGYRPVPGGGAAGGGGYRPSGNRDVNRPSRPGPNGGYHKPGDSSDGYRPQRPGQNGGYKPGGGDSGAGHRPQRPGQNGGGYKPGDYEESRDPYYPNKDLGGYEDPKDDDYNDDKAVGGGIKDDYVDDVKPGNDGNCICVPYYQCQDGHIVTDGAGIIDARKKPQPDEELPLDGKFRPPTCGPFHVCCDTPETSTVKPYEHKCGVRNPSGINSRILSPSNKGEADFGEWPWQAAVLKSEGKVNIFMCGGVLIDKQHIITVAHCVFHLYKFNEYPLKVRLGEWDTQKTTEFLAHEDYRVSKIIVHPEYRNTSLWNDIAILRLEEPVLFAPHIDTVCLPQYDDIFNEHNCVVTGWGKDAYKGGTFSNVMKEVALQVIDNYKCEEMLRKTRLGRFFQLHQGFMCAGGEYGLDSCKGDGGGPLVCYRKDKSYALAGIVSWGIDCGQPGVPGVYVKIQKYLDWISQNTGVELRNYWPKY